MEALLAAANPVRRVLCVALGIYWIVLFARIISSWFPAPMSGPFRQVWELLHDITEPVLAPFRRMLPPVRAGGLGFDFSPIVVFVILGVLQSVICF